MLQKAVQSRLYREKIKSFDFCSARYRSLRKNTKNQRLLTLQLHCTALATVDCRVQGVKNQNCGFYRSTFFHKMTKYEKRVDNGFCRGRWISSLRVQYEGDKVQFIMEDMALVEKRFN